MVILPYEVLGAHLWHIKHTHKKAYIYADINTNEPSICSGSCDDFNTTQVKHWWTTGETLVKTGETLVKHWWITCETLVKQYLNTYELGKHWWNSGATVVRHWLDNGKTLVRHWWNIGETLMKHWWNTCEIMVKNWWNTGETLVKHW